MKNSVHNSPKQAIQVLDRKFPSWATPHSTNTILHWNERMKAFLDFDNN